MRIVTLFVISLAVSSGVPFISQPQPHSLLTNYNRFPLALDTPTPRLSWNNDFLLFPSTPKLLRGVKQVAFEIEVQVDACSACSGRGCSCIFWASGQVPSLDPWTTLPLPLPSLTTGSWCVRVWSNVSLASNASSTTTVTIGPSLWSTSAAFETGPLLARDWEHAPWIARDLSPPLDTCDLFKDTPYPLLRWSPSLPSSWDPASARLYITGLGYFRVSVNGRTAGESALQPSWSNYNHTVPFIALDISSMLPPSGDVTIDVWLGAGW
jgi:alpha-L-rhamnosidase